MPATVTPMVNATNSIQATSSMQQLPTLSKIPYNSIRKQLQPPPPSSLQSTSVGQMPIVVQTLPANNRNGEESHHITPD